MIAIGIGANSRAQEDDFVAAIDAARAAAGGGDVVATLGESAFATFVRAAALGGSIEYRGVALEQLRLHRDRCVTHSQRSLSLLGVPSLAEAAALAAAGR